MATQSPLFAGWGLKRFMVTVANDIWPEVIFFSLVATAVSLVSDMTSHKLVISNAILNVLGTALSLVISFRTSSAYERYMEGRKLWAAISVASRNLAQIIWVHVPFERPNEPYKSWSKVEVAIEKKSMVNLVQAYSVSVKHMLRGEGGVYYEDLYPLICFLPRYATHDLDEATAEDVLPMWKASDMDKARHQAAHTVTTSRPLSRDGTERASESPDPAEVLNQFSGGPIYHSIRGRQQRKREFDPEQALPVVYSERTLLPARNPPKESIFDYLPFLRIFRCFTSPFSQRKHQPELPITAQPDPTRSFTGKRLQPEAVDADVPLEISLFLSSYLAWLLSQNYLQSAIASAFTTALSQLQDTVTNLDRIRNTPLPFAYQAHLRISLWLYLFFLPFQIWSSFNYLTIPVTAFASFLFLGFLEIGHEIENPFDYDMNDLDLDLFCLTIQRELHQITVHSCPQPATYIVTAWNQPFAPGDRRTAEDIVGDETHAYHHPDTGMTSMCRTLLQSWLGVEQVTRRK